MIRTTLVILLAASVLYLLSTSSSPEERFLDVFFTTDNVKLEIESINGVYDSLVNNVSSQVDGKIRVARSGGIPSEKNDVVYLDSTAFADPANIELIAVTDESCKACFIKGFFSRLGGLDVQDLPGYHVGYIHEAHLEVAKSLLRACNVSARCIGFKKITLQQAVAELDKPSLVDAIFFFGNDADPAVSNLIKSKLTVMTTRKMDKELLSILLPTVKLQDYDIRLMFQNAMDLGQPIHALPTFQNIMYVTTTGFPQSQQNYLLSLIIQRFAKNAPELDRLTKFTKSPRVALALQSALATTTELFMDAHTMQMTFMPSVNIPGYFDTKTNTFEYDSDTLEGTPLHIGDMIILKNQDSTHENGQYVVKAIIRGRTMMKLLHFKAERKNESKDDTYFCVTNPSIKFKNECLDHVDHTGRKKDPDVWDAPCTISHECPFFQQDPSTKAFRGGCKDGYCEMPIGTKLVGFKAYTGQPICKGCPRDMLNCCEQQKYPVYHFP